MTEKFTDNLPFQEQTLGELALRNQPETSHPFDVDPDQIRALFLSASDGTETINEIYRALNMESSDDNSPLSLEEAIIYHNFLATQGGQKQPSLAGQEDFLKQFSKFADLTLTFVRSGAQYIASFEDHEEGVQAGREALPRGLETMMAGLYSKYIVPPAAPIRQLYRVGRHNRSEIEAMTGDDATSIAQRYVLLKALANRTADQEKNTDQVIEKDIPPDRALRTLCGLAFPEIQRQLTEELLNGTFDHHIAQDLLRFMDGAKIVNTELAKIRQLTTFMAAFLGDEEPDKTDFYERMLRSLDQWPDTQRQVITDMRLVLAQRMETNMSNVTRTLKSHGFVGVVDYRQAFSRSMDNLSQAIFKSLSFDARRGDDQGKRHLIMSQRAKLRKKKARRSPSTESTGVPTELSGIESAEQNTPSRIVTCNLNDNTISEGADRIIDDFVAEISQGSSGDLRDDLERIVTFMARTDLPPGYRRGIKALQGVRVRFSTGNEGNKEHWNVFELKAKDAVGLPLRTAAAKDSRFYFIRLPEQTVGIIAIKPRAEQELYIRTLRDRQYGSR